jgi:hypothetical protein
MLIDILTAIGVVTRPIVIALLLIGIYRTASRAGYALGRRNLITAVAGVVLIGWYAAIWTLAAHGAFLANENGFTLAIPSASDIPLLLSFAVLRRIDLVKRLVDAVPASWIVGIQFYRFFGGVFLLMMIRGRVSPEFAWPASLGDMLTGVLAAVLAWRLVRNPSTSSALVYAWNILGILDLVAAQALGVMSSPGRFHVIALGHPNLDVGSYPAVMIPAYAVPLSLILHGVSLWQLRRRATRARFSPGPSSRSHQKYTGAATF